MVLPELKSEISVGALSVIDVPDVNPAMVSDSSDGMVSECVEVTVHGGGDAAVEAIEQDWAALVRAAAATRTAPTNNFRMRVSSGIRSASSPDHDRQTAAAVPLTSISEFRVGGFERGGTQSTKHRCRYYFESRRTLLESA